MAEVVGAAAARPALHRRSTHDLVLRHVTAGSEVKTVAAVYLLGERIAPNALNHRLWVLRTSAYWQSICAALIRLSDYLDGVGAPIDYQRRRNLDYSELLTEASWRQICTQAGDPLREPRTAVGAQCYLIEKLSGSPALRLTVQTPHSTPIRPPCSPRHAPTADSTTRSPSAELRLARNRAVVERFRRLFPFRNR